MKPRRGGSLARHRLRRRWPAIVAALLLAALVVADHNGWLLVQQADDLTAYHGQRARVLRVIDGDTLEIDIPDAFNDTPVTRVRLWGIDCPELAHRERQAEAWALEAKDLGRTLAESQCVLLWLEPHQMRDAFARVLAHVELSDGSLLNEALLEAGLAHADDRWPHARLIRYAQLEMTAKRRRIGLWSSE